MTFRVCLALILFAHVISAQDNSATFYEIVNGDSVHMFFTENHRFIEKKCAYYTRHTRLDQTGYFNGYFEDHANDGKLLAKGKYVNGLKNGYFEIYYQNGKLQSKGNYANGIPAGKWEYFYSNGLPERTLIITEADTLLERFIDAKGNLKVVDGNGDFNGEIQLPQAEVRQGVIAKGKIVNGKPDGKWTSATSNNVVYCKEDFVNGKFVRGNFPNAIRGNDKYTDRPLLNTFFLANYLYSLEQFHMSKCSDTVKWVPITSRFDMVEFRNGLDTKIDKLVEEDFRSGRSVQYATGDNYLTIEFSTDEKGKPKNFHLLNSFSQQFFSELTPFIGAHTTFSANLMKMYFHLKLTYRGGPTYEYDFMFSTDRSYRF